MARRSERERATKETEIRLALELDGGGRAEVTSGLGFFDHLLTAWARNALCDLELRATGDLAVDGHHTVEDCGLVLGAAVDEALGDRAGIRRYGMGIVPMDDALARAVLDFSGRPYLVWAAEVAPHAWGGFTSDLGEEYWRAFAVQARATLHIDLLRGRNAHHCLEAVWKAVGQACRQAWERDARIQGPLSTKGVL